MVFQCHAKFWHRSYNEANVFTYSSISNNT